jgi:hypothetical protein
MGLIMNTQNYIESLWSTAWERDTMKAIKTRPSAARIKTKNIIIDWYDPSVILFMETEIVKH